MKKLFLTIALLITTASMPARAQLGGQSVFDQAQAQAAQKVVVSAQASATQVSPGGQVVIAAVMQFADGWHAWPSIEENVLPDGFDFAIRTEVGLSEQSQWVTAGPVQWPELHDASVPNLSTTGPPTVEVPTYSGKAVAYIPLLIAEDAPLGAQTISIRVWYQACDETSCLAPESKTITIPIELVALGDTTNDVQIDEDLFASFDASVFQDMLAGNVPAASSESLSFDLFGLIAFDLNPEGMLGLLLLVVVAALGGFLLNLTPCVLPVIPLKIMGLSHSAGNPRRAFMLGTVMSVGVVGFWMAIGAAIAFVAGFDSISSLFQTSFFSAGVGLFIGIMGIGMLGVFTVQLPKAVYMINPSNETVFGSLLFGVMTAILSTPCTAPFMGTAAAWATQQTAFVVLLVFGAIGAGMALPYFVLSANPKWVDKVPRTGPSSELIKQVMGLFMLAVAAFFVGTGVSPLFAEVGHSPSQAYWWVVAFFLVGAMGWLVFKTFKINKRFVPRAIFTILALAMAGGSVTLASKLTAKPPIDWKYYTPALFEEVTARGDVIVLDFTADWCLNCKALERAVLYSDSVVAVLQQDGIVAMKIDLTRGTEEENAMLHSVGRITIPLLAIFGPGTDEPWLSDSYSKVQVIKAVRLARGASADVQVGR